MITTFSRLFPVCTFIAPSPIIDLLILDHSPTTAALEQSHRRTRPPSRPLRPDSLRRYAAGYKVWVGAEGMWIRTNYDAENEEAHQILWNDYMDIS